MSTAAERAAKRAGDRAHLRLVEDLYRACRDAGISGRDLARASGVDAGYLARILRGTERPTLDTYARLAVPLGLDLATRLYPNTGPVIRDRHQARMLELLLTSLAPRWRPYPEVAVRQPSRGWIDVVLHEPRERALVAAELQSELRRLEQLIRWHAAKAGALPSWEAFAQLGDSPTISRLLVVRRTRATRAVAMEFDRQLRLAYPAHPDDALAALHGAAPWPGSSLVWIALDRGRPRFVGAR